LIPIKVEVFCNVRGLSLELGRDITDALIDYINPVTYDGGELLRHNELEFVARNIPGVTSIDSILVDGDAVDKLAVQPYAFFYPTEVTVAMVDKTGAIYTYYGGLGTVEEGDED
jgi:hypothetical protein